jgi:hypothetical protein
MIFTENRCPLFGIMLEIFADYRGVRARRKPGMSMENLIFRGRPDDKNECEQWSPVRDAGDTAYYVVQEHVRLDEVLSGRPYIRLVKRMTVSEFLATDQPPAVKQRLQALLAVQNAAKT